MRRFVSFAIVGVVALFSSAGNLRADDAPKPSPSYKQGETIDPATFVYDKTGKRVRLMDIIDRKTDVVFLELMAGAYVPGTDKTNGGLWCEDTFNDMPVSRFLKNYFRGREVQFIAVAIPPLFSSGNGYDNKALLYGDEASEAFKTEFEKFVKATDALLTTGDGAGIIPFDRIYYAPKNRVMLNLRRDDTKVDEKYGPIKAWYGRLKSDQDDQKYGTPTIWLLSPTGEVLDGPFCQNIYASDPVMITYTIPEMVSAIEAHVK